jgi:hypothetical protein
MSEDGTVHRMSYSAVTVTLGDFDAKTYAAAMNRGPKSAPDHNKAALTDE